MLDDSKKITVVYLDWADFQYLKQGTAKELEDLFDLINERDPSTLFFPYSDFHLSDLACSSKEFHQEDLDFISRLTRNQHCRFDPLGNSIHISTTPPHQQFSVIMQARSYFEDGSVGEEISIDEEAVKGVTDSISDYAKLHFGLEYDQVIPQLIEISKTDPFTRSFFKRTLEERDLKYVLYDAMEYSLEMYEDPSNFIEIRNIIKSLGPGPHVSGSMRPLEEINKHLRKKIGKSFDEFSFESLLIGAAPSSMRQAEFLNFYLGLDLLGYAPEKFKKKDSNLFNLYNDLGHAFLASHFTYFVSSDKDNQKKAKLTFERFDCNAEVIPLAELFLHLTSSE